MSTFKDELNNALAVALQLERESRDNMYFALGGQAALKEALALLSSLEADEKASSLPEQIEND